MGLRRYFIQLEQYLYWCTGNSSVITLVLFVILVLFVSLSTPQDEQRLAETVSVAVSTLAVVAILVSVAAYLIQDGWKPLLEGIPE